MGIFSFIKSQFIEVIEWTDDARDTMVFQFPVRGKEIKMGAQLTVRPSQAAVFVNEGQIADVFSPGRYELTTQNMPILTKLKSWKYGFNSPFKAEVYFVNTRQFTDQKWGTMNPIMMRDAEFGMLRLRAYGIYSFRVDDPGKFMTEAFGTSALFTLDGISGQLKRSIVSGISDLLGEFKKPALDLAMYYDELSADACTRVQQRFEPFGLKIESLYIENISLPEEVEKVLDQRTSMGVIGNMGTFTQYQAAQAIREAARNEGGGLAGAGVGLGAGAALGQAFAGAMNQPAAPPAATAVCPHCVAQAPADAKFCPVCGKAMKQPEAACVACDKPIGADAKFCPHCGAGQQGAKCPGCGAETAPGAKFCPKCGEKL
ncbi:MAG: zinc-ribbon domain-containing protein [Clostridiales bacterium]|nr:zinc-ribbon domain-containing protein [Clostridiales bacterium]